MDQKVKASELLKRLSPASGSRVLSAMPSHLDRGILPSEMAVICGVSESLGILHIIESGRWMGFSTQTLGAYFEGAEVTIDSIEFVRNERGKGVEARLAPYKKVHLYYGDAFDLLPGLLERNHAPTAILLDGPKGEAAVRLASEMCAQYEHIQLLFFHDAYAGSETRMAIERSFENYAYTDEPALIRLFGYLDEGISIGSVHPEKYSGTPDTFPLKSYGPTIAVVIPSRTSVPEKMWWEITIIRARFYYGSLKAWLRGLILRVVTPLKQHRPSSTKEL